MLSETAIGVLFDYNIIFQSYDAKLCPWLPVLLSSLSDKKF